MRSKREERKLREQGTKGALLRLQFTYPTVRYSIAPLHSTPVSIVLWHGIGADYISVFM